MFWRKKIVVPFSLPAPEARIIAQIAEEANKFQEQQDILKQILEIAKRGVYHWNIYSDSSWRIGSQPLLTDEHINWLKKLGYEISSETRTEPIFYHPSYVDPEVAKSFPQTKELTIQTVSWK